MGACLRYILQLSCDLVGHTEVLELYTTPSMFLGGSKLYTINCGYLDLVLGLVEISEEAVQFPRYKRVLNLAVWSSILQLHADALGRLRTFGHLALQVEGNTSHRLTCGDGIVETETSTIVCTRCRTYDRYMTLRTYTS